MALSACPICLSGEADYGHRTPPRPPPTSRPTSGADPYATKQRSNGYRSGWHSTKLHLALIAMALVTAVFAFVVLRTGSVAGWGEYCITVVSIVISAHGSRVAESFAQRPTKPPEVTG